MVVETVTAGASTPDRTTPLLELCGLTVRFRTSSGFVDAVKGVDLSVDVGRTLGIVGESGSGKSATCLSILGLHPQGTEVGGQILFGGKDLLRLPEKALRSIRGKDIGLVYQDPMAALNPVRPVGAQLREPLQVHLGMSRRQADERAAELLARVGIPSPRAQLRSHPHQFSGGMRQRIVIAMALACQPALLLADEPTTALDVSVQAQVLDLLRDLSEELGIALVLVSHDLSVVAGLADHVAVMYAGRVVEQAPASQLFAHPQHAYTAALLASVAPAEWEDVDWQADVDWQGERQAVLDERDAAASGVGQGPGSTAEDGGPATATGPGSGPSQDTSRSTS